MKIHFWSENFLFLLVNHKERSHACMCRWHSWSCIAKCGMNPAVALCHILSLLSLELKDPFLDHQLWWSTELQASQHCRSVLLHTTLFSVGMNSLCVHSPYWTMMLEGILTWLAGGFFFLQEAFSTPLPVLDILSDKPAEKKYDWVSMQCENSYANLQCSHTCFFKPWWILFAIGCLPSRSSPADKETWLLVFRVCMWVAGGAMDALFKMQVKVSSLLFWCLVLEFLSCFCTLSLYNYLQQTGQTLKWIECHGRV